MQNLQKRQHIHSQIEEKCSNFGYQVPRGLPNMRNTCFLNSVLQQLYMIQPIRQMLMKPIQSQDLLIACLKKIFDLMKTRDDQLYSQQIRNVYKQVIVFLQKNDQQYRFGQQHDSLSTFLLFLNYLIIKDQKLSSKFEAIYELKCKCLRQKVIRIPSLLIQLKPDKCSKCHQTFQRQFIFLPEYMIIQGYNKERFIKEINQVNFQYTLQSVNVYDGNGRQGHYYTFSNYNKKGFIFNDSIVDEAQQDSLKYSKPLFAIYKKTSQSRPKSNYFKDFLKILVSLLFNSIVYFIIYLIGLIKMFIQRAKGYMNNKK